jgi:hypothetical protein
MHPTKGLPLLLRFYSSYRALPTVGNACEYLTGPRTNQLVLTSTHSHFNCWKTSGLLPWAAVLFVAGFVLREVGAYNYDKVGIYFASIFLLLLAP